MIQAQSFGDPKSLKFACIVGHVCDTTKFKDFAHLLGIFLGIALCVHKRKFDVLVVKLRPIDVLLPQIGAQIIAKNTVKVLSNLMNEYSDIVFHNFSGGVYLFGELLVHLFESQTRRNSILRRKIKGAINDSVVPLTLHAHAMSHTITTGPIKRLIFEKALHIFSTLFHIFITRQYEQGMNSIFSRSWNGQGKYF